MSMGRLYEYVCGECKSMGRLYEYFCGVVRVGACMSSIACTIKDCMSDLDFLQLSLPLCFLTQQELQSKHLASSVSHQDLEFFQPRSIKFMSSLVQNIPYFCRLSSTTADSPSMIPRLLISLASLFLSFSFASSSILSSMPASLDVLARVGAWA